MKLLKMQIPEGNPRYIVSISLLHHKKRLKIIFPERFSFADKA
jgi:hypothetical protein